MIRVNLPHMDLAGLSEGWLFRHCGHLHWRALCEALGKRSHELADDRQRRLYPVFVAVSARYDRPLSSVGENDELRSALSLAHYGRAFYRSQVEVANPAGAFRLEMITTFAARERGAENDLFRTTPADVPRVSLPALRSVPELLTARQAIQRGARDEHVVAGHRVPLGRVPAAPQLTFEPSPYAHFNGVGLLYFAAYPTLVDTFERQLVEAAGLRPPDTDWALAASTVARDVFYYRNLDLGQRLVATLNRAQRVADGYALHCILSREHDGQVVAEVVTIKRQVAGARPAAVAPDAAPAPCCRGRRLRAAASERRA